MNAILARSIRRAAPAIFLALLSCNAAPPPAAPGRGTLWGGLRLVPRSGVRVGDGRDPTYGPRQLREVELVDYRRPGFAVVFAEAGEPAPSPLTLSITSKVDPPLAAVGKNGTVTIVNRDALPHTVSSPALHLLKALKPKESIEVRAVDSGEVAIFVLDLPEAGAKVFVSPGPFSVVAADGRWELRDLAPGATTLHAWHPRFPTAQRAVTVEAGQVSRLDLEIGVDALESRP